MKSSEKGAGLPSVEIFAFHCNCLVDEAAFSCLLRHPSNIQGHSSDCSGNHLVWLLFSESLGDIWSRKCLVRVDCCGMWWGGQDRCTSAFKIEEVHQECWKSHLNAEVQVLFSVLYLLVPNLVAVWMMFLENAHEMVHNTRICTISCACAFNCVDQPYNYNFRGRM